MAVSPIPDVLAPFVMDFLIGIGEHSYHITRYDNHHNVIPRGRWVVCWRGEYYLCRGQWKYKVYSGFSSPAEALAALQRS